MTTTIIKIIDKIIINFLFIDLCVKICYNALIKAVKGLKGKKKLSKKGRKVYDTRQNA